MSGNTGSDRGGAKFELKYHPRAEGDLADLEPEDAEKIVEKVKALSLDPFPRGKAKKKIQGVKNLYRLRVDGRSDSYRAFYTIQPGKVIILRITPKKEADRMIEQIKKSILD